MMKITHTMASETLANRPTRRFYIAKFKTQVIQECSQRGASVAGGALSHGIKANIVHRGPYEDSLCALVVPPQAFVRVALVELVPIPARPAQPDIRVPSTARCTVDYAD